MRLIKIALLAVMVAGSGTCAFGEGDGWYTEGNFAPDVRIRVTLVNTLDSRRTDCPVTIPCLRMPLTSFYEASVFVVDPSLPSQPDPTFEQAKAQGSSVTYRETNGHAIPCQLDDLDTDGVWDELFFMTDLEPRETKTFFIYIGENQRGLVGHATHAEIGSYGRHLVPWWESEVMGWKLWYFSDADLYGKREPMLVANHENTSNISGYTAGSVYGNDIMTVEDTFGAGGICLFEDPAQPAVASRPRFSPFRGKGQIEDTRYAFDVVVNGPLRSMIRVRIMNWRTGGGEYALEQLYTAYKNKSYSTCRVNFGTFLPSNGGTRFGCGIRKLMNEVETVNSDGVIISLARDVDIFDPDVQRQFETRLLVKFLGTALAVKDPADARYMFVKEFAGNHTFSLPVTGDRTFDYLLAAGWSNGSVNKTAEEFTRYVRDTVREWRNPPSVERLTLERRQ